MNAITILVEIVVSAFAIWLLVHSSYKAFHSGLRGEPDEIELSKRRATAEVYPSNRGSNIMTRCATCNTLMFGGFRSGTNRYCSFVCYTASPLGGFCEDCLGTTAFNSPGNTSTLNTVGTRLYFAGDRCPNCHSIIQRKAFCILWIPIIPLSRYRVIYVSSTRYIGRRLR